MSSQPKSKPPASQGSLFILKHGSRRVLVPLPKDYDQLQASIRRHFPEIPLDHRVSYHTDALLISKGHLVEVSEDVWATAVPLLSMLTVESEAKVASKIARKRDEDEDECDSSCDEGKPAKKTRRVSPPLALPSSSPPPTQPKSQSKTMLLKLYNGATGSTSTVKCNPSTAVGKLITQCLEKLSALSPDVELYATYDGNRVSDNESLSLRDYGMEDGDMIEVWVRQTGGKPVIYLFPPSGTEVDASVKLSLVPEWHFSAIYPVVPIAPSASGGQALQWDVKASSDGTLLEKNTGLEAAYLFWEAEAPAIPQGHPSFTNSELNTAETRFDPSRASLDATNSVVLNVAQITPYLDSALKVLGLHTEARTSFITYWLPSFHKHTHIALRFLPQSFYEHAAPLDVTPKPDVTIRVFMLFKGLKEDEVSQGGWKQGVVDDVAEWRKVVGVDIDGERSLLTHESLFRVLEWGGMEVKA